MRALADHFEEQARRLDLVELTSSEEGPVAPHEPAK
jgi:hypothetical protein